MSLTLSDNGLDVCVCVCVCVSVCVWVSECMHVYMLVFLFDRSKWISTILTLPSLA